MHTTAPTSRPVSTPHLIVEFCGAETKVFDEIAFGRDTDIVLDESNRFMHRRTGCFRLSEGEWWLHNLAREHPMVLFGDDGQRSVLPAGTRTALTSSRGVVGFQAGPTPYEVSFSLQGDRPAGLTRNTQAGAHTETFQLQLTEVQAEVLMEFARPGLQNVSAPMPTYAEVAQRLEMRPKAVDHLLSELRADLRASGVSGIESIEGLITYLVGAGRLRMSHLAPTD